MAEEPTEKPQDGTAQGRRTRNPLRDDEHPSSADAELVTRFGKKIKVTDEEFAVMFEKAGGFRTRLAKQLGVTISAITHRIQRSAYLRDVCKTVEETVLDLAEAGLIKAAQNGEPWAITFILKCKGRKRGWIERQNLVFEGEDAIPPPIVIGIHDAAFVEAERKKNEAAMAEIVDATFSDVLPAPGAVDVPAVEGPEASRAAETAETWGATAQPLDAGTGDGAQEPPVGAEIPPESGSGAAVPRPESAGASAQGERPAGSETAPGADARAGQTTAQQTHAAPRVPRTPSEAAAMRRVEAERSGQAGQSKPLQPRPAGAKFAMPASKARRSAF